MCLVAEELMCVTMTLCCDSVGTLCTNARADYMPTGDVLCWTCSLAEVLVLVVDEHVAVAGLAILHVVQDLVHTVALCQRPSLPRVQKRTRTSPSGAP
jgi:hypothetical protein